jgi:hypothetical protein
MLSKEEIKRHQYSSTCYLYRKGDINPNTSQRWPCFAQSYGDTRFAIKPAIPKKDVDAYLALVAAEEPFKWWWDGEYVQFEFKEAGRAYVILLGNLCKGISEFSFWCKDIAKDKSNGTFFEKSVRAFEKYIPQIIEIGYNTNHGWHYYKTEGKYPDFTYRIPDGEKEKWKGVTIKKLFAAYRKLNKENKLTYEVWTTCTTAARAIP